MGLIWFIGNQAVRSMTESFVASRLEHDAKGLLAAMVIEPGGVKVRWRRISQVYAQPLSGHYYVIRFDDGQSVRSRSLWDQLLEIPQLAPGEMRRQQVSGPSDQQLLMLLNGYQKNGRSFTLGVAEDLAPIYQERDNFMLWFALLAAGGLLGLLLVQSIVVRRSFKHLEKVQEDMHALEQGKLAKLSEDVPSEVLPLVQEFNHLLHLLSQRLERSRNALGNLAHALKGPLNLLTQYFDAEGIDATEAKRQQARFQTERIRQLMERELKRARLAGKDLTSGRFNPAEELSDLIAVLQQLYRDKTLSIQHQVDELVEPFGDREDMLELLGNLLDNACKWATSKVVCHIEGGEQIAILVEDDGTGLKDDDIHYLTQRGNRLDENMEGHGLGLAIVGDIVKLYGGTISFSRSAELGGLGIHILLPRIGGAS
jgi:signal transduction histidine kinase